MKSISQSFSRTALTLLSLLILCLCGWYGNQNAAAAACTFYVAGEPISVSGSLTNNTIDVTADAKNDPICKWTAQSNVSWMTIVSGASGSASGKVAFRVDANPGAKRTGTLTVAGKVIEVFQAAAVQPACSFTVSPTTINRNGFGGADYVQVTANNASCAWTASSNVSWMTISNGTGRTGSGSVEVKFTANPAAPRTGTLVVAGKTVTMNQGASCVAEVTPLTHSAAASGGTFTVAVKTSTECGKWDVIALDPWIKAAINSGVGNATVSFTVAANVSVEERIGQIVIAGKAVVITQAPDTTLKLPILTDAAPSFAVAGSATMPITVRGKYFTPATQVHWNGEPRQTTFVSATELKASLLDADLKQPGRFPVTVYDLNYRSNAQSFLVVNAQASVSAASYKGESIAPDSIVAAFGTKLANATAVASTVPLPPALAGTTVRIIDSKNLERRAPLFFVSPGQVNYLMPADMPIGPATVVITSESGDLSVGYVNVTMVAPGLFTAAANGTGHPAALALRVKANGQQVYEPIVRYDGEKKNLVPMPIDLTVPGEQVFLILYGTGIRYHGGLNVVSAKIGGTTANPAYAGLSSLTGLDQLNVPLPISLAGRGEVDLVLTVNGKTANTVKLTLK